MNVDAVLLKAAENRKSGWTEAGEWCSHQKKKPQKPSVHKDVSIKYVREAAEQQGIINSPLSPQASHSSLVLISLRFLQAMLLSNFPCSEAQRVPAVPASCSAVVAQSAALICTQTAPGIEFINL